MSPWLAFIPLLTFIAISVGLGALIGYMARKKHRGVWLWRIAGALGFPVALVAILLFKDYHSLSGEQQRRSWLKEKIILGVIIALWVGSFLLRLRSDNA